MHENEFEKEEIENPSPSAEATVEKDIMQTPPIIHKTLPMDPRSVTSGINRTPIEVNSTPVGVNKRVLSAIPRHLQTKPYLETDIDKVMLCLTPKKRDVTEIIETQKLHFPEMTKNAEIVLTPTINNPRNKKVLNAIDNERYDILGLDPRSPAADFDRTPILMPKSLERLKARSQENLHRRGSYDTDIFYPRFSYCEMSSQFNVTEIEALPDFATDDKFNEPESPCSSHSPKSDSNSEIGEGELEDKDEDENERTLEEGSCDDTCVNEKTEQRETCATDNDIIKVWRDSLVLDESQESETNDLDDVQVVQKRLSQIGKEEVIITFDDESIIEDALPLKLAKSERQNEKAKVDAIGRKKKVVKSEVNVAVDEKKVLYPNDKNGNESPKIRTPLGNRSNNGQMKTLLNSPQQIFRSKGITPKMLQENTPPHKKFVAKPKLSSTQWDPDSTVII